MRNGADGNVQIYYSRENSKHDQDVLLRLSSDGGKHWNTPSTVVGTDASDRRDGMPGVAMLADKSLVCVFESLRNSIFTLQSVASTDDGKTWGPRQTVYEAEGPKRNAQSPQIANAGGDVLVVSFMTDEDTGTKDESVKVISSVDRGKTYANKMTVAEAPQFWPGLVAPAEPPAGSWRPRFSLFPLRSVLCMYGNGPQYVQKLAILGAV